MNVNNISSNSMNRLRFNGSTENSGHTGKKRYKRYKQMSDDVLILKSIVNAHKDVESSNKMKLYKAMPAITTGILGTCLAITQPGKLSGKVASGVGFLVAVGLCNAVVEKVSDKVDDEWKKAGNTDERTKNITKTSLALGVTALGVMGAAAVSKGINKIPSKNFEKALDFVKGESSKLADEINNTKFGKFFNEKFPKFEAKHKKGLSAFGFLSPIATFAGYVAGQNALMDSMQEDMKTNTIKYFEKGKQIQKIARQQFEAIDAIDVDSINETEDSDNNEE